MSSPRARQSSYSGGTSATGGYRLTASTPDRINAFRLEPNRAIAYAANDPTETHKTVVIPATIAEFRKFWPNPCRKTAT